MSYYCWDCDRSKSAAEFPLQSGTTQRSRYCRACTYQRQRVQRQRAAGRFYETHKVGQTCADCGDLCTEDNQEEFDFDHLPGTHKVDSISNLVSDGLIGKARAEIVKCVLVCAFHHARRTQQRTQQRRS